MGIESRLIRSYLDQEGVIIDEKSKGKSKFLKIQSNSLVTDFVKKLEPTIGTKIF